MDNLVKAIHNWKIVKDKHTEWRETAEKCFKYYRGKQWTEKTKGILRTQGRPPLTFNKIKPVIRNISGWQRQNRQDLVVLPRRGGIQPIAEVLTEILKYHYDAALADWKISQMFQDGIIGGKGWLAIDINYESDPINGELFLRRENPLMVYEDPYSQNYDMSDAKYIFRTSWVDKEEQIGRAHV